MADIYYCKKGKSRRVYYLAATASLAFSASWSLSLLPRSVRVRKRGKRSGSVLTSLWSKNTPICESSAGSSRTIVCARRKGKLSSEPT